MGKSTYQISFVERGKERLWREFWDSPDPTPESKEANRHGALGRCDIVEASNLIEAKRIVRERHPDCTVIDDACGRVAS